MKIVSDHGFPKGTMPTDDAFDLFKNEREFVAKVGKNKTTVAAMDWAAAEIERHGRALVDIEDALTAGKSDLAVSIVRAMRDGRYH